MPDNITHLPTDETLAGGLSQIASAIGEPFKLLKPSGTVTVTNGRFSVPYTGDVPANLAQKWYGHVCLKEHVKGIKESIADSIIYTISTIDTLNQTITFALSSGATDGVYTQAVNITLMISNAFGEILCACPLKIQGLPVKYDIFADPFGGLITVSDKTQATPFSATVYPQNVSPAVGLSDIDEMMDAYITDTEQIITYDTWDSQNISIPANIFDAAGNYEMFLVSPDQRTTIYYEVEVEA